MNINAADRDSLQKQIKSVILTLDPRKMRALINKYKLNDYLNYFHKLAKHEGVDMNKYDLLKTDWIVRACMAKIVLHYDDVELARRNRAWDILEELSWNERIM